MQKPTPQRTTVLIALALTLGSTACFQASESAPPDRDSETPEAPPAATVPTEEAPQKGDIESAVAPPTLTLAATGGGCTVQNTSRCVPRTTLTFKDTAFVCNKPLSSYGQLPLKVIVDFTRNKAFTGTAAVDLTTGCAGDGDPNTIDLIVDVRGDGTTYGPGNDAVKVRLGAGYNGGIQVTGHADCGPLLPGAHQDGVQLQGGRDIAFVDFSIGNYGAGRSTCQGGGGAFYYSSTTGQTPPTNIDVIRGSYIGCNHSLFRGAPASTGRVVGAMFRSGRVDGTDPVCVGYAASRACSGSAAGVVMSNVTCENWDAATKTWK